MSTHALRRFYRRWLPAVLALTAVVNLVANEFLPGPAQSFRLHESGSLTHLVHTEQRTVDLRYGIYMEMADALTGGTLFVPKGSALNADLAGGLSNVMLEVRDYDPDDLSPELVPGTEPLGMFQAGDERLAYWVLPDEGDSRWWLGHSSEGIIIIPESLAPVPEGES